MNFWRSTNSAVQKLYYEQFIVFGVNSKFHQFNTKRLLRMRKFLSQYNQLSVY